MLEQTGKQKHWRHLIEKQLRNLIANVNMEFINND